MSNTPDSRVGSVAVTRQRAAHARAPTAFLVVSGASLQKLGPAERSALAGKLAVPRAVLDAWIASRRALPVDAGSSRTLAERKSSWKDASHEVSLVAPIGLALWFRWFFLVMLAIPLTLAGAYLRAMPALVGFALFLSLGTAWTWSRAQVAAAVYRRVQRDWNQLSTEVAGPLAEVRRRIAAIRVQLAATDLPPGVAVDVRGGLDAIEDRAERLGKALAGVDEALARTPMPELESRRGEAVAELRELLAPLESLASDVARLALLGAEAAPVAQQVRASLEATTRHARRALREGASEGPLR